ncbi:MAG TPA: ABC transporter ATP-binding protein [Pusillimonas sp.]|jgi:ABC-type multidrug transport system ATPase subunit|nr:ABC transporter ATP-binding protein [Pusillimonas sp.]MBC44082.1 ABC transporter ATP-binding protein [Pusillimonas sp.]HBT33241.1 ABC transporter ATP-binding protein [Pusillimonas sp.]|tara:strand:- start:30548 stop:31162 length:615 start_codon:yes stop_codon:yes gene_type:complete
MLNIKNLSKHYDGHRVFQGLNYTFEPGCFALCEQESTGKSTLLNIVAGVIAPDTGDIWINGLSLSQSPKQAKARIAHVPDNCMEFPMETGRWLLEKVASEKNAQINDTVLDLANRLELTPHLEKRFEQLSTGMRRKVYLTAAAIGHPDVVIADGPTSGLDTRACAVVAEQFKDWSQDRVVLFASHDAELVQACQANIVDIGALR